VINRFALGDGAGHRAEPQAQLRQAVAGLDDLAFGQVQGRAKRRILVEKEASLLLEGAQVMFLFEVLESFFGAGQLVLEGAGLVLEKLVGFGILVNSEVPVQEEAHQ
jgi:hypothetical protein